MIGTSIAATAAVATPTAKAVGAEAMLSASGISSTSLLSAPSPLPYEYLSNLSQMIAEGSVKYGTMKLANETVFVDDTFVPLATAAAVCTSTQAGSLASPSINNLRPDEQAIMDGVNNQENIDEHGDIDRNLEVVESKVIDRQQYATDEGIEKRMVIEERISDNRYLEAGYLNTLIEELRDGKIPTIEQSFLLCINFLNALTFHSFESYLQGCDLGECRYRTKEIVCHQTLDSSESQKISKETSTLSTSVEERDYRPDKRTEVEEVKDVTATTTMNDVQCEVTIRISHEYAESKAHSLEEPILNDSDIAHTETTSFSWTETNVQRDVSTKEVVSEGYDTPLLKHITGKNVSTGDSIREIRESSELSDFSDLENEHELSEEMKHLVKSIQMSEVINHELAGGNAEALIYEGMESTAKVEFEDGLITWVPGGSLVNLGIKTDFGAELNKWDYFYAGVDLVAIGGAAVAGKVMTKSGLLVAKSIPKVSKIGKVLKHAPLEKLKPIVKPIPLKIAKAEALIYKQAGLMRKVVNGKICRVQPNIPLNYKDALGRTNLQRMKKGLPPIDPVSKTSYELHHVLQNPKGGLAELTRKQHRLGTNNKTLHTTRKDSPISHGADWAAEKAAHWKERARQFESAAQLA